jgi:aquaporin Z
MNVSRSLAEAIGAFALVFTGCGAIIVNDQPGAPLGHLGVSLVFGLIILVMIYAVGNVSGAHFNPAVTLAFACARRLSWRRVPEYVVSQAAGALLAAAVLRGLFPEHETLGATLPAGGLWRSAAMEVSLTFILMFVIFNVSTGHAEKGIMAGVAVGATIAVAALFGGPVSGASLNPARSLGPAVVAGQWRHLWLYLVAPPAGALLAVPTCRLVQGETCCPACDDGAGGE